MQEVSTRLVRFFQACADGLLTGALYALIGIGLILTNGAQLIFKADYRQTNIDLINRSVHVGPFGANAAEVLSFAIAAAFVVGLRAFVVRSRTGQALRA